MILLKQKTVETKLLRSELEKMSEEFIKKNEEEYKELAKGADEK